MILKEENLKDNNNKKILLDGYFKYFEKSDDAELKFDMCYDVGKGICGGINNSNIFPIITELTDLLEGKLTNLLHRNIDGYIIHSEKGLNVSDEEKRKKLCEELYYLGNEVRYPLFLQLGNDYFFINYLKFTAFETTNDMPAKAEKEIEELNKFISSRIYGDSYKAFKNNELFLEKMELTHGPLQYDKNDFYHKM